MVGRYSQRKGFYVPGVPGIKVDRDLSQGTVFGEADLNRVLRKLKKVDRLANAISAVKEKSQQLNSTRAIPPLCVLAGRHCLYPHVLGSNYLPVEDVISRLLCTAAPKWASDGNKPESSDATTIGAQYGDGNETDSSDTITRGATAVSNGIKSSPSQSRMAVHNHTSIDDGVHESKTRGLLVATSPDVAWRVSANKCSKYQVVVKVLWQYSTGQVILISWSAVHSQPRMRFKVPMCSENCVEKVRKEVFHVPGVVDIWADPLNSQVAVFGKVNPQQVLRKLRRVNKGSMYLGIQSLDLIKAVESGDAAKASEALAQPDVDVNCCEDTLDHLPPLLWAFQSKNRSIVRVLLADHRVDVNAANILGQRALHTHWDECVSEMLHSKREDIDWNATDKIGQTPLLFHARFGNDRIIRRLIQVKSVKLCARTIDGFTALHQVVEHRSRFPDGFQEHDQISSRCNIVDCLLEELQRRLGDDALIRFVNTTDILDRSVLHYIAEEGCVDILRRLLGKCSSHMDVNSVDLHGFTPLHLAIQNGDTGVVEVLLQLHTIDANVGAVNASHLDQPMIVHKINRMVEALEEAYLLRMLQPNIGANVSPDIPDGGIEVNVSATGRPKRFELHHFDMCRPNLLSKTPKDLSSGNLTPLHLAAMEGQMDIVCLLLKWEQINVFALDTKGFSPIDYSIQKGHLEVVKLLLDKGEQRTGFDYNIQIGKFENLLHLATKDEIAIHLLNTLGSRMETSTDTTTKFSSNQSRLLTSAAQNNHLKIIGYILKWQPEVNVNERSEWAADEGLEATPLHFAALRGHGQVVRELLKHPNLDVNTEDNKKMTALLYAIKTGNLDVVKALCEDKLNRLRANEESSDEKTPLQIVAEANNDPSMKAIEKVLLERPEVKDFVDRLYRDRQVCVDAANALLVGAALIVSVTFAGWLQPPLGYTTYYEFSQPFPAPPSTYESYAAVKHRSSVKAFWVFNSLSFFFAIATVLAGADAAMPNLKDAFIGRVVISVRRALILASILLVISVVCVLGAFASAGIAVLPPLLKYDTSMIITVCLGGTVCMLILAKILWKLSTPVHIALLPALRSNQEPTLRSVQNGEPLENLGE